LNGFGAAYQGALKDAMLMRLGLKSRGAEADIDLANAAFKALQEGGEALRWEPFFFDWFGGLASQERALQGPRGALYRQGAFIEFRRQLEGFAADRPERLMSPYFAGPEPQELLYDEIERIWAAIADHDDWTPFNVKLAGLEQARKAMDLSG
jgi:uncharacterized protein YdiU (UPF0061 family)